MRLIRFTLYFLQIVACRIVGKPFSEIIFTAVSDFGGVYIKLIQFICLRTNVFSQEDKLRFLSFYDNAPVEPIAIRETILHALGQEKANRFASVSPVPFASGTFGQVYRACLIDGSDIVIKVKRPHLLRKLKYDFFVLQVLTKIFNFIIEQSIIDLDATLSEFRESTYQELDYLQESKNADYFYRRFKSHPRLYIPKTYLEFCTQDILVQEYVGGVAVTDLIRHNTRYPGVYRQWLQDHYHTDIFYLFPTIAYDIALQGLHQGIFYADPHPGNIKLLPDNRYAYIDFGIVGSAPENSFLYYELVSAFSKKAKDMDMAKIGKSFLEWGATDFLEAADAFDDYFSDHKQSLTQMIRDKYQAILEAKREDFGSFDEEENFSQLCFDIVSSGSLLHVKVPPAFLTTLKTMIVFKSWVSYLEPSYHFMRNTYKRILDDVDPQTLVRKAKSNIPAPETSLETILEWMESMGESDFSFQRKIDTQFTGRLYV